MQKQKQEKQKPEK